MARYYTHVLRYGNKILVRGYENSVPFKEKVDFTPELYVTNKNPEESIFRSLDGKSIKPMEFNSIKDAKEFIDRYDDVPGFNIYGNTAWQYQYISTKWTKDIKWNINDISIHSFDIETTVEHKMSVSEMLQNPAEEITLISIQNKKTKVFTVFTARDYSYDFGDRKVNKVLCKDERELLIKFVTFWNAQQVDVITGWNIKFFDIPYIVGRMRRIFDNDDYVSLLSPWKVINERDVEFQGKTSVVYDLSGIAVLDYLDIYKLYVKEPRESYKLDHVAYEELGRAKVKNPYDSFKDFYEKAWDEFVFYNIVDVELVDLLDEKLKLIELQLTIAYFAKVNYEDIFGKVKVWETIIYNHLKDSNRIPSIRSSRNVKHGSFEGAWVKEPVVGKHKYVTTFDLDGLYPHIIMLLNMSPETLVNGFSHFQDMAHVEKFLYQEIDTSKAKEKNYSVSANGVCYDNAVIGFLPELMELYYDTRKKSKLEMLDLESENEKKPSAKLEFDIARLNNMQLGIKVLLNSLYGSVGNAGFRYFDLRMAEGITKTGQLAVKWIGNKFNQYLNKLCKTTDYQYWLYSDTDSSYLTLEPLVNLWTKSENDKGRNPTEEDKINFIQKFGQNQLTKLIEESYIELSDYLNAYQYKLKMKLEKVCDVGLFCAKKKYILNVWSSEGVKYAEPKLKAVGLELVKSSTPEIIRKQLKASIPIILYGSNDELRTSISEFREVFDKLSPEVIAFPKGVNEIEKYVNEKGTFAKGIPINVRASAVYNSLIDKHDLMNSYDKISSGDKMKFVYLRMPNPIRQNVVGFASTIPKEFGLSQYIDYDTMFEKVFLANISIMTKSLGWSVEPESSLKEFF